MKNGLILTIVIASIVAVSFSFTPSSMVKEPEDWKLPMVNNKIQFEFDSDTIQNGKTDLCAIYTSSNAAVDLSQTLTASMVNGKMTFWTASSWQIIPLLYNADVSAGGTYKMRLCNPKSDDTLIGSLNMSLTQVKTMRASRSGSIKCLYRIILKDHCYNIKFRGFTYSYYEAGTLTQPGKMVVVDLEDEYNEEKATKADKEYWADVKMLIKLYHTTLQKVLIKQTSSFNFDDK